MPVMAYGDGSIIRRRDGRLQVSVTVDGKRRYRMISARLVARDPVEARRRAQAIQRELLAQRDAELAPSGQTLADFLRSWLTSLRDAKRQRIRPRTLDHYAMIVERHIIPALGARRLDRLSERHVQSWLDADPGSPRTIAHHRAVLRRALNVALRQRLVARNVALAVELPPIPEFRGQPLTLDEARALLAATADDRLGPLWRLALDSGLRSSELLGLAWDDLDLAAGTVTVTSQLQRRHGAWVRTPTKAARSLSVLSLAPETVASLRAHQLLQAAERQPSWRYWGLVFVTPSGEPLEQTSVLRAFHAACDAAGIPRRRFHDLRGSSTTLLQELGVPEEVRMARLGHATKAMARRYAQARPGLDRAAADALGAALRRAK